MQEITNPRQDVAQMEMPKKDAENMSKHLQESGYDVALLHEEGKQLAKLAISHKNKEMMKDEILEQQFRSLKNKTPLPYAMKDYGRPRRP